MANLGRLLLPLLLPLLLLVTLHDDAHDGGSGDKDAALQQSEPGHSLEDDNHDNC